jgi:putative chitinase
VAPILAVFKKIAPKAYPNYARAFQQDEPLFDQFGINTPLRIAHFLAQTMYECGRGTVLFENLRYTTTQRLLQIFGVGHHSAAIRPEEAAEYLNCPEKLAERVYGLGNPKKARELGNLRDGDGYRYRGGGLIQTTGGDAYKRMGDMAHADFYGDPNLIVDPAYAVRPALYEWQEGHLNDFADKNDIHTITHVINGGFNGVSERKALFDRIWPLANGNGQPPEPWREARNDKEVWALQEALNDLGADPPLLVDGRYGPATEQAVKWFQDLAHIKVDGIAGPVTKAALNLRLGETRNIA